MTEPRQVLAGQTRMLTRRTIGRRFFLKPSREVNQLVEFLLAVGCDRYGIKLVAVYFASNHYHMVVVDPEAQYPAFLQWFNGLMAKALNALYKRKGQIWDVQQPNAPELADAASTLDRACYALGNPVKDGLVPHGREWPGVRSTPESCLQKPKVVPRPSFYFATGPDAKTPERAELSFHVPPDYEHLGEKGWAALLAKRLGEFEAQARDRISEDGDGFIGARGVKRRSWRDQPRSEESGPGLVPHPIVIARDTRVRIEAILRHRRFVASHKEARRAMLAHEPNVRFPHGTYKYPAILGLPCHPPPDRAS